jgi:DNA-binding CsgD family transcriptional regulator
LASQIIQNLHDLPENTSFANAAIAQLKRAIPCDISAYNEVDHSRDQICIEHDFADANLIASLAPALHAHADEHPVNEYQLKTGETHAMKISDFLTDRQFRKLGIYREFYQPIGVRRQMSLYLPGPPTLQIALTLQRGSRDFSERDRAVLNFLSPHLASAQRMSRKMRFIDEQIRALLQGAARSNQIVLFVEYTSGQIEWCSGDLEAFLATAGIRKGKPGRLPKEIDFCLSHRAGSWSVRCNHGVMRLALQRSETQIARIWLEFRRTTPSREAFSQFKLTPRETEILHYISEGKSNPEIALILSLSARTVQKHVEHILEKLRVENRAGAMLLARDLVDFPS